MEMYYNEDQKKLHELVKEHDSWSAAKLITIKAVQEFIEYDESAHGKFRNRLAGRLQFLKGRMKKFGLA